MTEKRDYDTHVHRSITILRPPEELFREWRAVETLVGFMEGAQQVDALDDKRSAWEVEMPGMGLQSWTAEITDERESEFISWRTVGPTRFEHEGTVSFKPAANGQGTEVTLEIRSRVPGGPAAATAAKALGQSPEDYVIKTLRNFKQLMETGEVATNAGPSGRRRMTTGVLPKVAAGMGAGMLLTTLYLRSRVARRSKGGKS
jgi:uncharacterized membrane protein